MTVKEKVLHLINELIDLNYIQGRHSGKWDCCEDKESIGDEYLENIIPFAREYHIPFHYELKDNFDEDEWKEFQKVDIGYAMDDHGYTLKNKVQDKILNMIENELDKE